MQTTGLHFIFAVLVPNVKDMSTLLCCSLSDTLWVPSRGRPLCSTHVSLGLSPRKVRVDEEGRGCGPKTEGVRGLVVQDFTLGPARRPTYTELNPSTEGSCLVCVLFFTTHTDLPGLIHQLLYTYGTPVTSDPPVPFEVPPPSGHPSEIPPPLVFIRLQRDLSNINLDL